MKIYFILIIAFMTSFLYTENFEIIYSEGMVSYKVKERWIEIEEGDVIHDTAIIRLDEGSFAEFEGTINNKSISFSLIQAGIYNVADFTTLRSETGNTGLMALIGNKVDFLLNTPPSDKIASMGARATERDEQDEITWDSAEDYLIDGIFELEKNNLDVALTYLEQALLIAIPVEEPEIYYFISLAYYRTGLKTKALKILATHPPEPDEYFYNDYLLLCGSLYAYTKNHQAAIDVLASIQKKKLEKQDKQSLYLIRGTSFFCIEKKQKAEENLRKAIDIDPNSLAGKNAAYILKQL